MKTTSEPVIYCDRCAGNHQTHDCKSTPNWKWINGTPPEMHSGEWMNALADRLERRLANGRDCDERFRVEASASVVAIKVLIEELRACASPESA